MKLGGLLRSAVTVSLNFLPKYIICVQQSHAAKLYYGNLKSSFEGLLPYYHR